MIVTENGRTLSGIVRNETETALTLQTPTEVVTLPKSEIEERTLSQLSLMPTANSSRCRRKHVRDLIAYLASSRASTATWRDAVLNPQLVASRVQSKVNASKFSASRQAMLVHKGWVASAKDAGAAIRIYGGPARSPVKNDLGNSSRKGRTLRACLSRLLKPSIMALCNSHSILTKPQPPSISTTPK